MRRRPARPGCLPPSYDPRVRSHWFERRPRSNDRGPRSPGRAAAEPAAALRRPARRPAPAPQPYGAPPGPYGRPGAGPYPGPPPHPAYGGPAAPYPGVPGQRPVNGLAIAALVVGLVCCIPPLGLVFGIIALAQIRRSGQRGKGMAVAGIALSAVSTLLTVAFVATGAAGEFARGFRDGLDAAASSPFDLAEGDCFDIPGKEVPEESEAFSVPTVDCARPHDAEVTGSYRLEDEGGYPGSAADEREMERRCHLMSEEYVPDPDALAPHIANFYYLPTRESWALGDRTVTCALAATEGRLTGSLKDGAGTEDGAPGAGTGV
ncbi:DUF4190 domain-containing protein [Streptomyces sanyensis]|uniref:DUF4190 domain-containing protein n=1 Tax=Streptomyces sanyensis TaxID=568869 RepID=UPI003D780075